MAKTVLFIGGLILLATFTTCSQNSKTKDMENEQVYTGMSLDNFREIYPELKAKTYNNTVSFTKLETIAELEGKWTYHFIDSKLKWFKFNKYIDEINQENFDKCLNATRQIIKNYENEFGEPLKYEEGKTKFIDPYTKMHWGYDVLKAEWQTDSTKTKVEFRFKGSKGEYSFIVKIDFE
jgi:hypothetical protein